MNQSIKWLTYLKSQSEQWVEQNSKVDLCPLTLCGICSQICTEENKYISSVQLLSRVQSLWPLGLQHTRSPCPSPTPRVYSNSCPSSRWYHPTISSSIVPPSPGFNLFQTQGLFKWVSSSHQVAKVLKFQLQHQSLQWIFRTDFL